MIERNFTKSFEVYRQVTSTDINGFISSELTVAHTFKGAIQQTSAEDSEYLNLSFNKGFTIFCPLNTDVISTDVIRYDGYEYGVRNLIDYTDGRNKHKQVFLEQLDEVVIGS